MAKISRTLTRADGSQVRITATEYFGAGLHRSVGVDVHHRPNPEADWSLASDRPAPGWRDMPLEEYERRGRAELFRVATHGEILSVQQELNSQWDAQQQEQAKRTERSRPRG